MTTRSSGEMPSRSARSSVVEPEPPRSFDERRSRAKLFLAAIGIAIVIAAVALGGLFSEEVPSALAAAVPALLGALAAWIAAFAAVAVVYVLASAADTPDLLRAAARASAPAMWFIPAMLFLSVATAASVLTGLALAANATRQLFSAPVPDRYARDEGRRRRTARLFQSLVEKPPRRAFPLLGACSLELGVVAIIQGNLLLAAVACSIGAAMWTRSAISRGAARPRLAARWQDTFAAVVLTLVIAVALAAVQFAAQKPERATSYDTARYVATKLIRAYNPPPPPQNASRGRAAGGPQQIGKTSGDRGIDGLPGVMLIPPPPRNLKLRARSSGAGPALGGGFGSFSQPFEIPFTGQYQLFAASVGQITPGSPIYRGSPLDMEYATVTGNLVDTVAWQPLDNLIDFSRCGVIRVAIRTRDSSGGATLQLVVGGQPKVIGLRFFGVLGGPEETLEYDVPDFARGARVAAIRLVFHRDTRQASHSVRVAVRGFTLIPRGR